MLQDNNSTVEEGTLHHPFAADEGTPTSIELRCSSGCRRYRTGAPTRTSPDSTKCRVDRQTLPAYREINNLSRPTWVARDRIYGGAARATRPSPATGGSFAPSTPTVAASTAGRSTPRARSSPSGRGRACRRRWPGSRRADAGARCDWRLSSIWFAS